MLRGLALAPLLVLATLAVVVPPRAQAIDGGAAADELSYVGRLTAVHRTALGETGERCGAALVAPTWAVTAAHCTAHERGAFAPGDMTVSFGSTRADGAGGHAVRVVEVVRGADTGQDIALLRLDGAPPVKPVLLADRVPTDGSRVLALGWGRGTGAAPLENADMRVVSAATSTLVSVPGGPNAGLANSGDSGGPLLVALPTGGHALVGIARSVMTDPTGNAANVWVRTDAGAPTHRWLARHLDPA